MELGDGGDERFATIEITEEFVESIGINDAICAHFSIFGVVGLFGSQETLEK